jgi:hypothetical protein
VSFDACISGASTPDASIFAGPDFGAAIYEASISVAFRFAASALVASALTCSAFAPAAIDSPSFAASFCATVTDQFDRYVNPAHQRYWRIFRMMRTPITLIGLLLASYISFDIVSIMFLIFAPNNCHRPIDDMRITVMHDKMIEKHLSCLIHVRI